MACCLTGEKQEEFMSALAYSNPASQSTPSPRPAALPRQRARSRREEPVFRKLPAFPGEHLYFEPKPIDNSMVVRANDPRQHRTCWRAVGAVVTGALVFIALLLPSAYRMVAGMQIHTLRAEQQDLLGEIAELRAVEANRTNLHHLEELARKQELIDPDPAMVQHLTPKGSYAMNQNSLPSGK
jgi:hypothetical protein